MNGAFGGIRSFAQSKRDKSNGQEMRGVTQDQEWDETDNGRKRKDVRGEN